MEERAMNNRRAVIEIAKLAVSCPECGRRLGVNGTRHVLEWTPQQISEMEGVEEHDRCPMCPECGEFLTIIVPDRLDPVLPDTAERYESVRRTVEVKHAQCCHDYRPVFVDGSFMGEECSHCGAYPHRESK